MRGSAHAAMVAVAGGAIRWASFVRVVRSRRADACSARVFKVRASRHGWMGMDQNYSEALLARITMGCKASRVCVFTCERKNRGVLRFRQRDTFFLVVLLASWHRTRHLRTPSYEIFLKQIFYEKFCWLVCNYYSITASFKL
jgi:hypothetical protein